MSEQIAPQRRDDSLRCNSQQVDLREVQNSLDREESNESESDLVEKTRVMLYERCVEKSPDYLRKREPDADADDETDNCAGDSRCVRTHSRKKLSEWLR